MEALTNNSHSLLSTRRINMKPVYLTLVLSVCVNCQKRPARQVSGDIIPIISYVNENNGDGSYMYSYKTGNGISVEEEGSLKPGGENGEGIQTARGSYSYTAPDGRLISVTWYADETGFHAQDEGDNIPGPPAEPRGRTFPDRDLYLTPRPYSAPVYPIK